MLYAPAIKLIYNYDYTDIARLDASQRESVSGCISRDRLLREMQAQRFTRARFALASDQARKIRPIFKIVRWRESPRRSRDFCEKPCGN